MEPRDELGVEVVQAGCCVVVGSDAAPPRKSENRDAALFFTFLARQQFAYRPLPPLEAVGHGAAGFRLRYGPGGGL